MIIWLLKECKVANSVGIMCFSPTNTTRKICNAVALGMGSEDPIMLDMTLPDARANIIGNSNAAMKEIDHLIVGAPVYAGKLPLQTIDYLRAFNGNGKECTAIVVYGNRDYGIALYNMVEILLQNGCTVVSAGAFIGQHSYSDIVPVAVGRPDESDIDQARKFGIQILSASRNLSLKDIPAQLDKASQSDKYHALRPFYNEKHCVQCGKCAKICPLGLLLPDTGSYLSRAARRQCIGCMACVRSCKQKARIAKTNPIVKMVMNSILRRASKERKEPLIII
jgi:Pyruvate/2-oxoacid:ferredoxin oxidoreductase delta subunit